VIAAQAAATAAATVSTVFPALGSVRRTATECARVLTTSSAQATAPVAGTATAIGRGSPPAVARATVATLLVAMAIVRHRRKPSTAVELIVIPLVAMVGAVPGNPPIAAQLIATIAETASVRRASPPRAVAWIAALDTVATDAAVSVRHRLIAIRIAVTAMTGCADRVRPSTTANGIAIAAVTVFAAAQSSQVQVVPSIVRLCRSAVTVGAAVRRMSTRVPMTAAGIVVIASARRMSNPTAHLTAKS